MKSFFCAFLLSLLGLSSAAWSYHDEATGPENWGDNYAACNGQAQSPINIVEANVQTNFSLGQFTHTMFATPPNAMLIKNNGHSLQVDLTNGYTIDNPYILPAVFKAVQFHFHWGNSMGGGSEHTLDGGRYFAEMHIVHYNTKYPDAGAAIDQPDGLAVLGFLITDDYPQNNLNFERILEPIGNITYKDEVQQYEAEFSIETLLPNSLYPYYRYQGSLTTPGCFESVVWTVFKEPIQISSSQAQRLYTGLKDDVNATLYTNYRPVQPLNGRIITQSSLCGSASGLLPVPHVVLSVLIILTSLIM